MTLFPIVIVDTILSYIPKSYLRPWISLSHIDMEILSMNPNAADFLLAQPSLIQPTYAWINPGLLDYMLKYQQDTNSYITWPLLLYNQDVTRVKQIVAVEELQVLSGDITSSDLNVLKKFWIGGYKNILRSKGFTSPDFKYDSNPANIKQIQHSKRRKAGLSFNPAIFTHLPGLREYLVSMR